MKIHLSFFACNEEVRAAIKGMKSGKQVVPDYTHVGGMEEDWERGQCGVFLMLGSERILEEMRLATGIEFKEHG